MNKAYFTFILGIIFTACGLFLAFNDSNFYNKYHFKYVDYPYGNKTIIDDKTFTDDITSIKINLNEASLNYKKDPNLNDNGIRIVVKHQEFVNTFVKELVIVKDGTNIKIDNNSKGYDLEDLYYIFDLSSKSYNIIDKQLYYIRSNFYKNTFVIPTLDTTTSKPEVTIYYGNDVNLETLKSMINNKIE